MEITSPEAMAKFVDDVRQQEAPFVTAAMSAFESLVRAEYRRLRAQALECGSATAVLNITAAFNFDPAVRTVDMTSSPKLADPRPNRKSVKVG